MPSVNLRPAGPGLDIAIRYMQQSVSKEDKHHREEQNDRAEVDEAQGIFYAHRACHEHQDSADDRRTGTVDFHPWEFPEGKDHVTRNENRVRSYGCEFRHPSSTQVSRTC